jgi:hypothetical protein
MIAAFAIYRPAVVAGEQSQVPVQRFTVSDEAELLRAIHQRPVALMHGSVLVASNDAAVNLLLRLSSRGER